MLMQSTNVPTNHNRDVLLTIQVMHMLMQSTNQSQSRCSYHTSNALAQVTAGRVLRRCCKPHEYVARATEDIHENQIQRRTEMVIGHLYKLPPVSQ